MNYEEFKDTTFAIVSNYGDFNEVVLADGLQNALKAFLQSQRILTSLLPDKNLIITGQDGDPTMPLMTLFLEEQSLLSLQTVSYCDGNSVVDGKLKASPNVRLVDKCDSFLELAYKLNKVYAFNNQVERVEKRFNEVSNSWPARHLTEDYFTPELASFEESCSGLDLDFDVNAFSEEIDCIRLSYSFSVTVTGE